jgi:eukaryotic-like serine/threonine-protein kinase
MSADSAGLASELQERYVLQQELGRGGMATVYQAHDRKHDRTVALKVLHDDLAASLGPERFKREIRIAARLQHPHILSVFDSGETARRLWFTMPFVSGESLRDRLRREGPLPVETAVTIVREAAQALAYAHRQGVIHRDIKPENILVTEDGATLVADFGIARALGDSPNGTGAMTGLTQTGSAIGTPTYMAPEQATGEGAVDEKADQYALATVLYEMLTGSPPFTGVTPAALIAARFTMPVVPVRERRPEVPVEVDLAVQRALSLKPADRFPGIADFARAVAPSLTTPSRVDTVNPPGYRRKRVWPLGVAAVGLVGVVGAGFVMARRAAAAKSDGPIRIVVLPFQNLGDSTDKYFADGMVDELRGKLVQLPGVEVIARASSVQYAGTTKSPGEIAKELDVKYLLGGTVRWERKADGKSVVHLRPELMEVGRGGAATSKWQQSFDQPLTDVTSVQGNIAQQVAGQLQLALGSGALDRLKASPTSNPAAYDAYLRGVNNKEDNSPAVLRRRMADLERAVALDPNFADAWSHLAAVRSNLYANSTPDPELARAARTAAERARAAAPGSVADHTAWYMYYSSIAVDLAAAEREVLALQAIEPNNARYMMRVSATRANQGRLAEAIPLAEAATRLDPLNSLFWSIYSDQLRMVRRYPEAIAAARRAAALAPAAPASVLTELSPILGTGDIEAARAAIRNGYSSIPPAVLDVYLAIYHDNGWLLDDEAQRRVLAAPLEAFDGDAAIQAIVQAQIYRARGDTTRSRAAAEQGLKATLSHLRQNPDDPQQKVMRAFSAGLAGRNEQARAWVEEAEHIIATTEISTSNRSYFRDVCARTRVLIGDYDQALALLETILAQPGLLTPGHLRNDPIWTPLRGMPRFQRLLATGGSTT